MASRTIASRQLRPSLVNWEAFAAQLPVVVGMVAAGWIAWVSYTLYALHTDVAILQRDVQVMQRDVQDIKVAIQDIQKQLSRRP